MRLESINRSGIPVPKSYMQRWLEGLVKELKKKKILSKEQTHQNLFVAFVEPEEIKALNKEFRGKDKATDVLSFATDDPELIGELVICPQVIRNQAKEHKLTQREEMAYMLTHGLLHLLGYEHEQGGEPERIMFELQDSLFEKLRESITVKP